MAQSLVTNRKSFLLQIIPVMLCFFVMGFVDLVGIASRYVQEDLSLSDSQANMFPSLVFFWFLIFSVPTGMLMNKIGRKNTVLISLIITAVSLFIPHPPARPQVARPPSQPGGHGAPAQPDPSFIKCLPLQGRSLPAAPLSLYPQSPPKKSPNRPPYRKATFNRRPPAPTADPHRRPPAPATPPALSPSPGPSPVTVIGRARPITASLPPTTPPRPWAGPAFPPPPARASPHRRSLPSPFAVRFFAI